LPGTNDVNDSICYFRHALALDERRVKFLPEYIRGGESSSTETSPPTNGSQKSVGVEHKDDTVSDIKHIASSLH
jgi:hypothetical protein